MSETVKTTGAVQNKYKKYFDLSALIKQIEEYLPNFNKKLFTEAFYFAEKAHSGQFRKDKTTPYIVHPFKAAEILAEMRADQDVLISAILHDVPEDTNHSIDEIKEKFGPTVAFLVEGITKLSKVHYQHNMPEREVESLKKLLLHSAKDLRVIIIKLADRLHNMRTLEFVERPEKRVRISGETLEIYVPIANLLGIHKLKGELEELSFKYLFPSEYESLIKKLRAVNKKLTGNAHIFIRKIKTSLENSGIEAKIYQIKPELYRAYKKLCAQGRSIVDLKEKIFVRVVVDNVAECYQTLGIIHGEFVPKPDRFKDYIAHPKINGYQSLHSAVFGVDGVITHIQIRTKKMDMEDEFGIATNFLRKDHDPEYLWNKDKRSLWVNQILGMDLYKKTDNKFIENIKSDILEDRIVAFSPKGKAIDLPRGSSAIDFAFAIHSEVGKRALKALVNGKLMPITSTLKSGDVVKIVTAENTSPKISWLSFVKTTLARERISYFFRKSSRSKRISEGKKLLQKEFDIAGMGIFDNLGFANIRKIVEHNFNYTFKNRETLLLRIGEGAISAHAITKAIRSELGKSSKKKQSQELIGITLNITAKNRPGLLMEITRMLAKNTLDMSFVKATTSFDQKKANMKIQVMVDDFEKVSKIVNELEEMEDIYSVYSITNSGLINFYVLAVATVLFWSLHPFALAALANGLISKNSYVSSVIAFLGMIMLMAMLMNLNYLIRKHFPLIRYKSSLWIISFIVISAAVGVISSELLYYDLKFGWVFMLSAVLGLYGFWGISYWRFRKFL